MLIGMYYNDSAVVYKTIIRCFCMIFSIEVTAMYSKSEYNISTPVITKLFKRYEKETIVSELKRLGVHRVFLTRSIYQLDANAFNQELQEIHENCAYLKENGFEVGLWGWSFLIKDFKDEFYHICSLDKKHTDASAACPLDPKFREFAGNYAAELAKTGVDILLYDDDYRLAYWSGVMACGCDVHMKRVCEILGENITAADFKEKVLSGGKNKYRDAYLKVNREALTGFASYIRKCVDAVNPDVRIGVCSCMNWDFDGVAPSQISRIFAGNTRPFLRLIGATYWPTQPKWSIYNRLGAVIEFERMELSWCPDDIEVLAEGDTYPRPRFYVPSSYLELFDTAIMADGGTNGILKYALDYSADPNYETAYVDAACKNRELYKEIRDVFSQKIACGVRVIEKQNKFVDMVIPDERAGDYSALDVFFSPAAKMVSSLSIPSTYTGNEGCCIVFGENARGITEDKLRNGAIIDFSAAQILQETGIDVGIVNVNKRIKPSEEYYVDENRYVLARYSAYDTEINENADVKSVLLYTDAGQEMRAPASYYYENAAGQRFLVFTFDMYYNDESCYRTYTRGNQIIDAVKYLSGDPLPASMQGCPDLYMMCKRDDNGTMAVGLWNIFADPIPRPEIRLDKAYNKIHFINCNGHMDGNKVYLSEIAAFGFAGFEVQ